MLWKKRLYLFFFLIAFVDFSILVLFHLLLHYFHGHSPYLSRDQRGSIEDVSGRTLRSTNQAVLRCQWVGYEMTEGNILYHATGDAVWIPACSGWPHLLDGLNAWVHLFPFCHDHGHDFLFLALLFPVTTCVTPLTCPHPTLLLFSLSCIPDGYTPLGLKTIWWHHSAVRWPHSASSFSQLLLHYHLAYAWLRQDLCGITLRLSWIPQGIAYMHLGRTEPGCKIIWYTSHKG